MRVAFVPLAALLLSGCGLITGVDEDRFQGTIGYPDDVILTIPETVYLGQEFTLTLRTIGADGCWRNDRTDVTLSSLAAAITPYDVRRTERGVDCTMAVVDLLHTANLTFDQAGLARVTVRGRDGMVTESVVVE